MNDLDRMNKLAEKRDDIRRRREQEERAQVDVTAMGEFNPNAQRRACICDGYDTLSCDVVGDECALREQDDEVEGHKGPLATHYYPPSAASQARAAMRKFDTGATRNVDDDNLDFEGFISPLVWKRYAEYMHEHRRQADGTLRASDNWQKGIPFDSYMKSGFRHFMDWWLNHRGLEARDDVETALCALLFNVQGYLHEHLKAK